VISCPSLGAIESVLLLTRAHESPPSIKFSKEALILKGKTSLHIPMASPVVGDIGVIVAEKGVPLVNRPIYAVCLPPAWSANLFPQSTAYRRVVNVMLRWAASFGLLLELESSHSFKKTRVCSSSFQFLLPLADCKACGGSGEGSAGPFGLCANCECNGYAPWHAVEGLLDGWQAYIDSEQGRKEFNSLMRGTGFHARY
jgi:hypothetical protein